MNIKKGNYNRFIFLLISFLSFFCSFSIVKAAVTEGTVYPYDYTGGIQVFQAPATGYYRLEVWGAQGGYAKSYYGGYGGYATGAVRLTTGQNIYIGVGGKGANASYGRGGRAAGGYNGGGSSTPAAKSSDNSLSSLFVNDGTIKPNFTKDTVSYSIMVPNHVTSLNLRAIASDTKAKVSIKGNSNFKIGTNVVTIDVTAEDGSVRTYVINVERSEKESQNKLEQLVINGGSIKPNFDPDVYEYDISVPGNVDSIDVNAIPANSNAKVEVIGNENLKEGDNAVLVRVTDENGFSQYYRLNVNRATSNKKILGLLPSQWWTLFGFLFLVGLLLLILFLVLRKKDEEEQPATVDVPNTPNVPNIEFKPEFNFGSKNGTDDDIVQPGGVLNQYTGSAPKLSTKEEPEEIEYNEVPYDPYDEVVTKDEMYDALEEAMKTKDPSKLQMLYDQEKLNRKKEKMKQDDEDYE